MLFGLLDCGQSLILNISQIYLFGGHFSWLIGWMDGWLERECERERESQRDSESEGDAAMGEGWIPTHCSEASTFMVRPLIL